jgi:hypothetical protein
MKRFVRKLQSSKQTHAHVSTFQAVLRTCVGLSSILAIMKRPRPLCAPFMYPFRRGPSTRWRTPETMVLTTSADNESFSDKLPISFITALRTMAIKSLIPTKTNGRM